MVSLLARKYNVPVVPHVGDVGQIHQHLVLFNHIALGHPKTFLEHIPHLNHCFAHPVQLQEGDTKLHGSREAAQIFFKSPSERYSCRIGTISRPLGAATQKPGATIDPGDPVWFALRSGCNSRSS